MNEWIKDKKPPKPGPYLVTIHLYKTRKVELMYYNKESDCWYYYNDFLEAVICKGIEAWRELPAPYTSSN